MSLLDILPTVIGVSTGGTVAYWLGFYCGYNEAMAKASEMIKELDS